MVNYLLEIINIRKKIKDYLNAFDIDPQNINYLKILSEISLQINNFFEFIDRNIQNSFPDMNNYIFFHNLGQEIQNIGNFSEAKKFYNKAIELNPESAFSYNNLGIIARDEEKFDDSFIFFQKAKKILPESPYIYENTGLLFIRQRKYESSLEYLLKAVEIKKDESEFYRNLGSSYFYLKNYEKSEEYFKQALELNPDDPEVHSNLAVLYLLRGDFNDGWTEFEWRLKTYNNSLVNSEKKPLWDGSDLINKTLLVYTEQGFGDDIQFARFLSLVKKEGTKLILCCKPELTRIFKSLNGVDMVVNEITNINYDFYFPIMSFSKIFNTGLKTIPADIPYLKPDRDAVKEMKEYLEPYSGFKIGIVWESGFPNITYYHRSTSLEYFFELTKIPGVTLFSLQKSEREQKLKKVPGDINIINLADKMNDFHDTACIIENLDLVISVDTAVVHLAGALGKPVWGLINYNPDWRWMLNGESSPWYPTLRLFRQKSRDDWKSVFEQVIAELGSLI